MIEKDIANFVMKSSELKVLSSEVEVLKNKIKSALAEEGKTVHESVFVDDKEYSLSVISYPKLKLKPEWLELIESDAILSQYKNRIIGTSLFINEEAVYKLIDTGELTTDSIEQLYDKTHITQVRI